MADGGEVWNDEEDLSRCDETSSEGDEDDDIVVWRNEIALLRKHNAPDPVPQPVWEQTCSGMLNEPPDLSQIMQFSKENLPSSNHNMLVLNHSMVLTLQMFLRSVKMRLKRNREEQEEIEKYLEFARKQPRADFPSFKKCGIPYFAGHKFYPPENSYMRVKSVKKFIAPTKLIKAASSWLTSELHELRKLVMDLDRPNNPCLLQNSANQLKVVDTAQIDWLLVAAKLDNLSEFSPDECEAAWTHIIGTHLNVSPWRKEEKSRLFQLAEQHYFQNWDTIASKLGTGRSGWQCCVHFQRRFLFEVYPWSPDEDQKLKDLISLHSKGDYIPWCKIYYFFDNRTCRQIRERYEYRIRPSKRGKFSLLEDEAILSVTETYNGDVKMLKKYFPDRALPSVYRRYRILLKEKAAFTIEEDRLLLEAVTAHGTDWNVIAEALPGRQAYEVRTRYSRLLEFTEDFLKEISTKQGASKKFLKSLPEVRSEVAVMAVLELMWRPRQNTICPPHQTIRGINISKEIPLPMKQLLQLLQFGGRHLFGPIFAIPRFIEERKSMASRLSYLCTVFSVNCDFAAISNRLEDLPTFGHPEEVMLCLRELPAPTFTTLCGQCWVPPSALTLLGFRVLLSSKSFLIEQSSLHNQFIHVWRNENVRQEDRLTPSAARSRLRSRMIHMFFLSACVSQVTRNVVVTQPKVKKPKKKSASKLKRHAKNMGRARWKKHQDKLSDDLKPKLKQLKEEKIDEPQPKKAKMIRVTSTNKSTTRVQCLNSESYEAQVEEPVVKKRMGRPPKVRNNVD